MYVVLGFLLAWIAGVVAREEVTVGTGVIILIATGVISMVVDFALAQFFPDGGVLILIVGQVIWFGVLAGAISLFTNIALKHALIIAGIFTTIMILVALAMAAATS